MSYEPVAARARPCFARERFEIHAVDAVDFPIPADESLPRRLRYQHHRLLHRLYELGAINRDVVRPGRD